MQKNTSTGDIWPEIERIAGVGGEFTLRDEEILRHKGKLLKFLRQFSQKAGDSVFLNIPVKADVLDMDVCRAVSELYASLDIEFAGVSRGGNYLFDKKFFSSRAKTLNTLGLVFGFVMDFALVPGDSVRLFRDRLDFALSLYPNHVSFPQVSGGTKPKPTATFSTQDISMCAAVANAVETFYSAGRAVTWFLSSLAPLRMTPSAFFRDFSEWQELNNCGLSSSWRPGDASHGEIERMQLEFLSFKFEEKGCRELFEVVSNVVRLNGALSRCFGEGEECEVELSYNPDELLGAGAFDIKSFAENSIEEHSRVRVFMGDYGPTYRYC
ncbi:hypothetical protein [Treponema saccharophilum]|uniref:Uncharacterized protein n=1 Tax=Treponema saccharophilum DSM 2985 TaxID=907348 RepID=H7EIX9_9SPIR|nr:hypothetical protein [Treponema saccharophilum]EIC02436.1 hypothetical protein TresaDRAFT_2078 [Treponema saccharophilum DSM 2985]BDC96616.1 hypothetical protein TRSA_17150 [Treponema saccharophilum]